MEPFTLLLPVYSGDKPDYFVRAFRSSVEQQTLRPDQVVVVQDEPKNQGAWPFLALNLPEALAEQGEHRALRVISRAASASPATGSTKKHQAEQADLVARAFDR